MRLFGMIGSIHVGMLSTSIVVVTVIFGTTIATTSFFGRRLGCSTYTRTAGRSSATSHVRFGTDFDFTFPIATKETTLCRRWV